MIHWNLALPISLIALVSLVTKFPSIIYVKTNDSSTHHAFLLEKVGRTKYDSSRDGCIKCVGYPPCWRCEYEPYGDDPTLADECWAEDCIYCTTVNEGNCALPEMQEQDAESAKEVDIQIADKTIRDLALVSPRLAVTLAKLRGKKIKANKIITIRWTPVEISAKDVEHWIDISNEESKHFFSQILPEKIKDVRGKPVVIWALVSTKEVALAVVSGPETEPLIRTTVPLQVQ